MGSFSCKNCNNKQYCPDCKKESGEDIVEVLIKTPSHVEKQSHNKVSICGNHLFYKGICYKILDREEIEEKKGSPNIVVRTHQELTFYLRETQDEEYIFIKLVKSPKKNISSRVETSEFKKLEKNLLGSVPEGLIANNTW